jgi:hypothetical protein
MGADYVLTNPYGAYGELRLKYTTFNYGRGSSNIPGNWKGDAVTGTGATYAVDGPESFVGRGTVKATFGVGAILIGAKITSRKIPTAFRAFTKRNYIHNLEVFTGELAAGRSAHHLYPQAARFQAEWTRLGINIHHPVNMRWWGAGHFKSAKAYNADWDDFFVRKGGYGNATKEEVQAFGNYLINKDGF